jgi:hypothetical protein
MGSTPEENSKQQHIFVRLVVRRVGTFAVCAWSDVAALAPLVKRPDHDILSRRRWLNRLGPKDKKQAACLSS